MISRRVCGDSVLRLSIAQGIHGIAGPAYLESPHFLQIFAFEKECGTQHIINSPAGEHRGVMDKGLDPFMGLSNVFQRRLCSHLLLYSLGVILI
jgi:hypothetical protein